MSNVQILTLMSKKINFFCFEKKCKHASRAKNSSFFNKVRRNIDKLGRIKETLTCQGWESIPRPLEIGRKALTTRLSHTLMYLGYALSTEIRWCSLNYKFCYSEVWPRPMKEFYLFRLCSLHLIKLGNVVWMYWVLNWSGHV